MDEMEKPNGNRYSEETEGMKVVKKEPVGKYSRMEGAVIQTDNSKYFN